mmetsp:Transcript_12105/g.31668  ORF Transcript_12105/g.31668 Transcript_12105/m.31668 type:complete len:649 (-) Transcript_12105:390-2336(-)
MDDAALAELAARLREAGEAELESGLSALAQVLSECPEEDEDALCCAIDDADVLPPLISRLAQNFANERLTYLGLSSLVNVADVGGADLVLKHSGLELLLSKLDSEDTSTQYYACAGIQNVTSDAFVVSAFVEELGPVLEQAEARLEAILEAAQGAGKGEGDADAKKLAPIAACAEGALANLHAIPLAAEYANSVEAPLTPMLPPRTAQDEGGEADEGGGEEGAAPQPTMSPAEYLEAKLQRAMRAREAYDAEQAAHGTGSTPGAEQLRKHRHSQGGESPSPRSERTDSPARMRASLEACERLVDAALMAAEALAAPRYAADAVAEGDDPSGVPSEAAWLQNVQATVEALARHLSNVTGAADEAAAVEAVERVELIGPLIQLLLEQINASDRHLVYVGLSILVNLADMGGALLVHAHGGFELLCSLLRANDLSVRYYAVAGVQNLLSTPECAARAQGTGVEEVLYAMLEDTDNDNEQIARCAAGAIANIRRADPERRPEAAAAARGDEGGGAGGMGALGALSALPAAGFSMLLDVFAAPFRPLLRGLGLFSASESDAAHASAARPVEQGGSGSAPDTATDAACATTGAASSAQPQPLAEDAVATADVSTASTADKPGSTSAPSVPAPTPREQQSSSAGEKPVAEWKEGS